MTTARDFDAFWSQFVLSHTRPATQWMHTAGVGIWLAGAAAAVARRRVGPFVVASAAFGALALGAHPLFEGDVPANTSRPLYAILANVRMAWCTVRGTMADEVARAQRAAAAS